MTRISFIDAFIGTTLSVSKNDEKKHLKNVLNKLKNFCRGWAEPETSKIIVDGFVIEIFDDFDHQKIKSCFCLIKKINHILENCEYLLINC